MIRSTSQRIQDTRHLLATEDDVWVATASGDAVPHMVPFSLHWDGEHVIIATEPGTATVRNLTASPAAKLAIGDSRDVVIMTARAVSIADAREADRQLLQQFSLRVGWNPDGADVEMVFVTFKPERIHAWRDVAEIPERTIMRSSEWLDTGK